MNFFSDFYIKKGSDSIFLFLHGFTGGSGAFTHLLPLIPFDVCSYTFLGHGEEYLSFHSFGAKDWLNGARNKLIELKKEYKHLYLAGYSLGGLIALILAKEINVDALFLFAPALKTNFTNEDVKGELKDVNPALLALCDEDDKRVLKYFLSESVKNEEGEIIKLQKQYLEERKSKLKNAYAYLGLKDNVVNIRETKVLLEQEGVKCNLLKECNHALLYGVGYKETIQSFKNDLNFSFTQTILQAHD